MKFRLSLALGFAGAAIDLISGYAILSESMVSTNDMGMVISGYNQQGIAWGVGLFALAAALLITSALGFSSVWKSRMRSLGGVMTVYGVLMIVIGALMYSGFTPMMNGFFYSSMAMFIVGFLMVLSGGLMMRKMIEKMPKAMGTPQGMDSGSSAQVHTGP